jgi:hypothetical protein
MIAHLTPEGNKLKSIIFRIKQVLAHYIKRDLNNEVDNWETFDSSLNPGTLLKMGILVIAKFLRSLISGYLLSPILFCSHRCIIVG